MAYSPLGQGDLLSDRRLAAMAAKLGVAPATLATAFVLSREGVVAIPKAAHAEHLPALRRALEFTIDRCDARGARPRVSSTAARDAAADALNDALCASPRRAACAAHGQARRR